MQETSPVSAYKYVAAPAPASPDMKGSTTLSAAAVAATASKALPPRRSISAPAFAASGWAAATIPFNDRTVDRPPNDQSALVSSSISSFLLIRSVMIVLICRYGNENLHVRVVPGGIEESKAA